MHNNISPNIGVLAFVILGHMPVELGQDIDKVISSGQGLAYITYPTFLAQHGGPFIASLFFFMFLCLGPR